jgi:hypothetical protein
VQDQRSVTIDKVYHTCQLYAFTGVSRWGGVWGVTPPQSWKILFFFGRQFSKFRQKLTKIDEIFLKKSFNPPIFSKFSKSSRKFSGNFQNFSGNSQNFSGNSQNFSGNSQHFSENSQHFSENSQNFSENFQHFSENSQHFSKNFLHPPNFLDSGTPLCI